MKRYSDIAGDGGSRIVEQVTAQQERLARALSNVHHRVAIASGKGGVGKSTLTFAIAAAWARAGARVAVLDADLNGPSQARLAGLGAAPLLPGPQGLVMPRTRAGVGVVSLGSLVPGDQAIDFDSVAQRDSQVWRATYEFSFLGQLLASIEWGSLDYLLVDLPPGAERTFQFAEFLGSSTSFVLVTLPSALSREVVGRSATALGRTPNRVLGWVENMSGLFPSAVTGEAFGVPCLGRVPFDPRLAEQIDDSPVAADALGEVARAITRALETGDQR